MDSSSRIRPQKSLLVIGGATNPGSTNPTPSGSTRGYSSKPGPKRDSRNYDDSDNYNLAIKKPRTMVSSQDGKKIVALDVRPLAVVEPETPKLSRQFWKAGEDKEEEPVPRYCSNDAAVRVHPQFLHANATSHKWALGALAELLDNSLDEVSNGATYVHVNSTTNQKDGKSSILVVEDNGGGMDPIRFRECLSLGYSRKRNMTNKVGQYGNGFKTSTMRLGADAIVFTRCRGTNGKNTTQSIGMLSYTFLYETRKCEAIVPTVDFELVDNNWKEITYDSRDEWFDNLDTLVKWSPYLSQQDLFDQFDFLEEQGTRIVIYNLWEDDEKKLELDFDTDPHDIQLRGVNRDEKNIEMAKAYPNSRHFLTYRHSLRSYVSILYLRLPPNFKIILRGKDVDHHSLLDDMMMTEDKIYRPVRSEECSSSEEMVADLKIGFVKDAHHHIDIQGFNVYHKNRLIKPFWRVWNAAGSDGRGVIGLVEANFIQPAHNKQGFERTAVLAKLENRLNQYQKTYWSSRCHEIGYAPRRKQTNHGSCSTETTLQRDPKFKVPFDTRSFSNAAQAPCRQNVAVSGGNRNSQDVAQSRVVDRIPEVGLKNRNPGHGISFNEARSINQEAELQKVKEESAKQVAELQRQKAQIELQLKQSKAKIQDLEMRKKVTDGSEKRAAELLDQLQQSKAKIQDLEMRKKVTDGSEKRVAELLNQLQQSKAKIQDLEMRKKVTDGSEKRVAELLNQLQQSKAKIQDLEMRKKVTDGSEKRVAELFNQLEQSKAKIQDLETRKKVTDGSEKRVAELFNQLQQSKAKIQDLEMRKKVTDGSEKRVAELLNQLEQSKAKIQDLEEMQKGKDDLKKLVAELMNQLKESKAKIQDLEKTQKVKDDESAKQMDEWKRRRTLLLEEWEKEKDGSLKMVDELRRQKALLEEESQKLKQSKAKIEDLEKSQSEVADIFQEERARRDGTEHDLRKKLREASDAIRTLTMKLNNLEAEKSFL